MMSRCGRTSDGRRLHGRIEELSSRDASDSATPTQLRPRPEGAAVGTTRAIVRHDDRREGRRHVQFLVTLTHDLFAWYALPDMVTHQLERDREALGLDRRKYVMHVLMRRYHEVLEHGPGFDKKAGSAPPGRKGK